MKKLLTQVHKFSRALLVWAITLLPVSIAWAQGIPNYAASGNPGSVLVFNYFGSDATNQRFEDTTITIKPLHAQPGRILFFVINGSTCAVERKAYCVSGSGLTLSAFNLAPGVKGYAIAVAVDETGTPINFNYLVGKETIATIQNTITLDALGIGAIALLPAITVDGKATLSFDGINYSLVPRTVALDSIITPADGVRTLLLVNSLSGDLSVSAGNVGSLFGLLYKQSGDQSSWSISATCQLNRFFGENLFPRVPDFPGTFASGQINSTSFWPTQTGRGISAAALYMTATKSKGSPINYTGGRNLYVLKLDSASLTIPVGAVSCP